MTKNKRSAVLGGVLTLALAGGVLFARQHGVGSGAGTESSPKATATRRATPLDVAETVYDGRFGTGWEDWGWGPHDTTQPGPAKVVFEGYGGIILHHTELSTRFGALSFRYKAPPEWGNFLYAALKYRQSPETALPKVVVEPRHVAELADGWREVLIDWRELNPTSLPVDRVVIGAGEKVSATWVLLDKIVFTKGTGGDGGGGKLREQTATLRVACDKPPSPINPLIYGTSVGVWSSGTTAKRTGGNVTSRFNWDLNAWNTGSDWFFENIGGKGSFWENIEEGPRRGIQTALVVPTLGWVAKDTVSSGFPISKFPRQRKTDSYRPSAGDGHYPDGSPISPGPPTETSMAAPPELIGKWIKKIREQDAARGSRTVHMYILDNEPSLWNETHRDVHPDPVTYDELLDRTIRYASEIRKADPEAVIAGPAEWGWTGYFYSAKDRAVSTLLRPDRRLHGDVPLIPWYLQQLAAYEKEHGVRLLDVLNVHFYPAADGVYGNARTDPDSALLRLRSTRSLWDPSYEDESWIKDRVRLIPRLKEWVRSSYPGTKIAIGEWHFGAEEHISGALAMAEALGRFGQHGLDAAFLWGGPKENTPAFWAFRAFRNFDGQGGRFLDWSVPTTTTAENASFFASKDENGSRIVAIVLNLDPLAALRANIELTTCGTVRTRRMFSYKAGSDSLTDETAALERDGLTTVVAPFSFQVLDLSMDLPKSR